ncbi:MAG TPA: prolyl oligopeptidase family serine peptidase [Steroidobacteraceae bacterium]|nr:prolyl oligopeptidase family serine peptidase [Steroidobacteraceae bacterium]
MRIRITLAFALAGGAIAAGPAAQAGTFTLEQVLSAPFPSALTADPLARRFAWVERAEGRRNVWVATPRRGQPGFEARALTRYGDDDGQDLGELRFVPGRDALVYVRGGDFEAPDKPYPNPAHAPTPPEQDLWLVTLAGGAPVKLAEGHAPVVAPGGERVVFLRKGDLYGVAPRAGAKPEELIRGLGDLGSVRFAPDGRSFAFVSLRGDHSVIGLYSFAERRVRWLDAGFGFDVEPTFAPDGRRIAFLRLPFQPDEIGIGPHRTGTPWSIRLASVDSGASTELYRAPAGRGSVFHALASEAQLYFARGEQLVFPAETDGWLHLYAVPTAGGAARLLTPGAFEVEFAAAAPDGSAVVYAANAGDIERRHLWRVALPDGAPTPLTPGEGIETMPAVGADNATVAYFAASARRPMHAAVLEPGGSGADLRPGGLPAGFPADALVVPQPVTLTARDGVVAHGDLFLPPPGTAAGRRPAVVFMHGGPIRQMLLGWHYMDYYSNAYALNQYLASRGYVVLALNYRAGIGYGLEFREAEHYGATGASEYNDVLAAAEYLRGRADVDPARLGLWGGSYGGYLTALGLARNSELFAAGVDVHGVHDWYHDDLALVRHNVPYYDRDVSAAAVETAWRASPMSAVASWRSPALFVHGDDDRNVSFSETTRLVTALRARGVDCEELVLPDEIHDFLRHASFVRVYTAASEFLDRRLAR